MKKLILLSILLIVGCAPKIVTLNYDEITDDCKIECKRSYHQMNGVIVCINVVAID